jgi:hypothetical protein
MRSPTDVQADFGLLELSGLPKELIGARVAQLAKFASDYDAAFERLSSTLHARTRRLRELEAREVDSIAELERWRIYTASHADVIMALYAWHAALGTDTETALMANLRERVDTFFRMTPPTVPSHPE